MNSAMASFNTAVRQMTEMSQRKENRLSWKIQLLHKKAVSAKIGIRGSKAHGLLKPHKI